jgi:hypothetical protein
MHVKLGRRSTGGPTFTMGSMRVLGHDAEEHGVPRLVST